MIVTTEESPATSTIFFAMAALAGSDSMEYT
jgi:hypothetical protein